MHIEEQIDSISRTFIESFKKTVRGYTLFHAIFAALAFFEIISLALFFPFFAKSQLFAFLLAALFLTAFSYFVLLFYFQAKKPEELQELQNSFFLSCQQLQKNLNRMQQWELSQGPDFKFKLENVNNQLLRSFAANRLISHLHLQEYRFYPVPTSLPSLASLLEKFSAWSSWKELYKLKESLLFAIIEEHIELIKKDPIDIQMHSSLSHTYRALANLYTDPRKSQLIPESFWVSKAYLSFDMQEKFKAAAHRAIEELKIIDSLSPQEPLVYKELSSLYHDLGLQNEEIQAYEQLVRIHQDEKARLRLGILYFKTGACAKGLHIYSELKQDESPLAEELIGHYGDFLYL